MLAPCVYNKFREELPTEQALGCIFSNDPSAGSPTETLLRLLLPLSDMVYLIFRIAAVQKVHRITRNR